ncbi:MAG TPA: hypothetical protein VGI97_03975 [Gemmatimonadaceae bacterium]|jgi:hypothetical protein
MQHRHLLPNEIDLLLDGEAGFGVAPLQAHVAACEDCQARLARSRKIVHELEDLPRLAPRPQFADRVMAQVQIVEPWHVALAETARRFVPQSARMRVVMAATASAAALVLTSGAVWLALHADLAIYSFNLAAGRARGALVELGTSVVGTAFGQGGLDALRSSGLRGLALGTGVMVVAVGGAAFGFRALASSSRRSRE